MKRIYLIFLCGLICAAMGLQAQTNLDLSSGTITITANGDYVITQSSFPAVTANRIVVNAGLTVTSP